MMAKVKHGPVGRSVISLSSSACLLRPLRLCGAKKTVTAKTQRTLRKRRELKIPLGYPLSAKSLFSGFGVRTRDHPVCAGAA
jgi:hypothetical protein